METARILIVDDEAPQRKILAGYLKKQGCSVGEAASAREALEMLKAEGADVLLTDLRMPEESGHDLLLKALAPESTGVIMTAFGTIRRPRR